MEEEKKSKESKKQEFTYEQLEQIAVSQQKQLQTAYKQLEQLIKDTTYKRLDYLFKVVENKEVFKKEFTTSCISEIEQIMIIPEEDNKVSESES